MAYRRNIAARSKLFYEQQHRVAPSFSHIHRNDSDPEEIHHDTPVSTNIEKPFFSQHRFFGNGNNCRNSNRRFAIPIGFGSILTRNFSSGSFGEAAIPDKIEILTDVLVDKSVEVAPVVNEVAVAATGSFYPVAALQYFIDYVHYATGFNWWASIVVTTILIRTLMIPIVIHQLKSGAKFALLRPKLEKIKEKMQSREMTPLEGQALAKELFNKYGVTQFTPMKGLLISAPLFCSFFFAVKNMAEKVPSFKEGGTLWFTDLSTPDTMYIFPVLTALSIWITVELNTLEGMEGNSTARIIKNVLRGFAALSIPLTASFPKAIFCYWITTNLFSLTSGLVMKKPEVKKLLGIPIVPMTPISANKKPELSFFETLKKYAEAQQKKSLSSPAQQASLSSPAEATSSSSKPGNQRNGTSVVLSQRIKSLEKEVKGRKKGKKRRS